MGEVVAKPVLYLYVPWVGTMSYNYYLSYTTLLIVQYFQNQADMFIVLLI